MTSKNTTQSNVFYPVANAGASSNPFVWIFLARDPTSSDVNYPIQKVWLNTSTDVLWFLKNFSTSNGIVSANWQPLSQGAFTVESFAMQTGTTPVLPTGLGQITFDGAVVAAGTHPVRTDGTGPNTMTLEVQTAQAIASTNAANIGLAAFNSADFTVDANGFVSATGSVALQFTGTTGTATPLAGNINIFGASTIAGTTPVSTTASGSTVTVDVQKAQAIASTNAANVGLAAFNSADFTVDANGFVSSISSGGIVTIDGDTGSITGSTVKIFANNATQNAGSTVLFSNSGTTSTFNVTDAKRNTIVGSSSGNASVTGQDNTSLGFNALTGLTSGQENIAIGNNALSGVASANFNTAVGFNALSTSPGDSNTAIGASSQSANNTGANNVSVGLSSLQSLTSGSNNVCMGESALANIVTGNNNTCIGHQTGTSYTGGESNNILIRNPGTTGEFDVIRIGTTGTQTECFIAGIASVSVSNEQLVVINTSSGQLGSIPISGIFTWTDTSGAFSAAKNTGYFITATATGTLPASPSQGDTIKFFVDTTQLLTIQANTGQTIRLGSLISSTAGTATSSLQGDSVELTYRASDTCWCAIAGYTGTWTMA